MPSTEPLVLDVTIKRYEKIFRWMGMNLDSRNKTAAENRKTLILYYFNFIWLNTDVAGAVCWFIQGANAGENLTTLTYVAPCITLSFLANIKSYCFVRYHDEVSELMSTLRQLEIVQRNRPFHKKTANIIKSETKFLNVVLKVLNFFNWGLIMAFPSMALSQMIFKYHKTGEWELLLPFLIVYPFNPYDIKYWPFVYVRQIWSVAVVVLYISASDYFFYIGCAYIRLQFMLLQHNFEVLVPARAPAASEELRGLFVRLVQWHLQLIRSVDLLEKIYTKSTLYNFMSSSTLICLTGFNVTTIDDTAFVVSFLSFLFMSLLQIYFICFFGDALTSSSMEVADAVYNCNWFQTDAKFAKQLHITHLRAQKPCKLSAFGYADVNLRAFTKILSTAWSYFALLKTVYSSPRGQQM